MIRIVAPVALLIVAGCSDNIASLSCSDVADEAIRASKGDLMAINNRVQTSKDDKRLTCHGTGLLKDGEERFIRFQALLSDNGEMFFKYDDDEHQAAEAAKEARQEQREQAQTEREVQRFVDQETQKVEAGARFEAASDMAGTQ